MSAEPRLIAQRGAALFFVIWLVLVGTSQTFEGAQTFVRLAVLLAVSVLIPLGLALIEPNSRLLLAAPVASAFAVGSVQLPQGPLAAAMAAVYLSYTVAWAFVGLGQALSSDFFGLKKGAPDFAGISRAIALLYLPGGAIWLVASRLGLNPMGFVDLIVLLTALHFHFSGFCAPLLLGLAGRKLEHKPGAARALFRVSAVAVATGTPLLAIGFTVSPPIEFLGATLISSGISIVSVLLLIQVLPTMRGVARAALGLSALSGIFGMALALYYAAGEVSQTFTISIPQMARFHGTANALGFALGGLLGWTLRESDHAQNEIDPQTSVREP